jgi:hypothetical protein
MLLSTFSNRRETPVVKKTTSVSKKRFRKQTKKDKRSNDSYNKVLHTTTIITIATTTLASDITTLTQVSASFTVELIGKNMATSRPVNVRQGQIPFYINDENQISAKQQSTGASGKTPVNKTKRRAFGDISNRKLDRNQTTTEKDSVKVKNGSTANSVIILNDNAADVQVKDVKGKNLQSKNSLKRRVKFNVPPEQSTTTARTTDFKLKGNQERFVSWKDVNQTDLDNSLEIEQAAGRIWAQQWKNGDHDSSNSDCSLEGLDTAYADHKKVRETIFNSIQHVRQLELDEEDRYYEEMKLQWTKFDFGEGKRGCCVRI